MTRMTRMARMARMARMKAQECRVVSIPDGGHILERRFKSRTIVPTLSVQFQRSFPAVNP
jgi:hypothetical protein